jgi:hypothetical protein
MHLHTGPSYRLLPITGLLIFGSSCSGGESPVDSRSRKLTNALNEAPVLSPERPDAKTHSPVQLLTSPDALCTLSGDGIDQAIPIWADELGIVTFGAIRAKNTDPIRSLALDCTDDTGYAKHYALDLTSESTFQPLPSIPIPSTVHIRPALTGDPMQYAWADLLHLGYGSRPDPAGNPREYARWLKAVSAPARRSATIHPAPPLHSAGGFANNNLWTGGVLNSSGQYNQAYGSFTVPTAQTTSGCTDAALWPGVGGSNNDLIQTGVELHTSGSTSTPSAWLEYWSGNGVGGNGYQSPYTLFSVNPGDSIFADAWACDSSGSINASGGYGCFYIDDSTAGKYADCYLPTGGSWSGSNSCHSMAKINTFVGATAEAIIENSVAARCGSGTWTQFGPSNEANITLTATRTDTLYEGTSHNYTTDSNFPLTLTNGSGTAMNEIGTDDASPDGTSFYWLRGN